MADPLGIQKPAHFGTPRTPGEHGEDELHPAVQNAPSRVWHVPNISAGPVEPRVWHAPVYVPAYHRGQGQWPARPEERSNHMGTPMAPRGMSGQKAADLFSDWGTQFLSSRERSGSEPAESVPKNDPGARKGEGRARQSHITLGPGCRACRKRGHPPVGRKFEVLVPRAWLERVKKVFRVPLALRERPCPPTKSFRFLTESLYATALRAERPHALSTLSLPPNLSWLFPFVVKHELQTSRKSPYKLRKNHARASSKPCFTMTKHPRSSVHMCKSNNHMNY